MPQIRFNGGLNQRKDTVCHLFECTAGQNFRLDKDTHTLKPRAAIELITTAAGADPITSIMQFIDNSGSASYLVQADDSLYEWNLSTTLSSVSAVNTGRLRGTKWSLDDFLVIQDLSLANNLSTWDGSSFAAMTTGLTNMRAGYTAVHNGRLWAFYCRVDGTNYYNVIMASEFENANNFSITEQGTDQDPTSTFTDSSDPFFLVTPDLKPVNGVAAILNDLVISTYGGKLYKLTGDDASNYNFVDYYSGSSAVGIARETMTNIGNDVLYIRESPTIELLSTTEKYGDTRTDDLSIWIPDELETSPQSFNQASIVYDQLRQLVLIFITGRVLVLDKSKIDLFKNSSGDIQILSPWTKYVTSMTHNFVTETPTYIVDSSGNWNVYYGDYSGNLYKFFGTEGNPDDDGTERDIVVQRSTKIMRGQERVRCPVYGEVLFNRGSADCTLDINIDFLDEMKQKSAQVTLIQKETGGSAPDVTTQWDKRRFTPPGYSQDIQMHFEITADGTFEIDNIVA